MIKGWRNDPKWVALYEKREAERVQRAQHIAYIKLEHEKERIRLNDRIASVRYSAGWKVY